METDVQNLLIAAIAGYVLGSMPFGLVLCRLAGLGDIRKIGSGNIGATNVLRTGNKFLAALTLILDSGKGAIAVLIAVFIFGANAGLIAGCAAVIGHNFPLWLKFKGGKGVATTLGTLLAISWPIGVASLIIWLLMAALFRMSSLAALVSLAAAPVVAWVMDEPMIAVAALALAVLSIIRHRENIKRIVKGTEPRIGAKKTDR